MSGGAAGVIGWLFVGAAALTWAGWTLLPVRAGPFLEPAVFDRIRDRFRPWIWLYRAHLSWLLAVGLAVLAAGPGAGT